MDGFALVPLDFGSFHVLDKQQVIRAYVEIVSQGRQQRPVPDQPPLAILDVGPPRPRDLHAPGCKCATDFPKTHPLPTLSDSSVEKKLKPSGKLTLRRASWPWGCARCFLVRHLSPIRILWLLQVSSEILSATSHQRVCRLCETATVHYPMRKFMLCISVEQAVDNPIRLWTVVALYRWIFRLPMKISDLLRLVKTAQL